jgi:butyrate kinase
LNNEKELFADVLRHDDAELDKFGGISKQYEFRMEIILNALKNHNIEHESLNAVCGRGGLLYPVEGGTYSVNDLMLDHLHEEVQGEHASNLGGLIARAIGDRLGIPSFIVDPVVVDELCDYARLSGHPELKRRSIFHALNQKACARKAAEMLSKKYEDINLVVAHLGGGISVGAHYRGRVIDVNNALNGDGPYSPERSVVCPLRILPISVQREIHSLGCKEDDKRQCGLKAYTGSADVIGIENKALAGDKDSELVYFGMAYQIAKEIGLCAVVLKGDVDAIVLSGGIAYANRLVDFVREHAGFIAPFIVIPGEAEMEALALGSLRVMRGEEKAKVYKGNN